jgi:hypothetical protein
MKFHEHYVGSNYINFLHTGPKPVPLLGNISPSHVTPSHHQIIHFNVTIQLSGFQELSFSLRPPQKTAGKSALDLTCHMPRLTL